MASLLAAFNQALVTRPMLTRSATSMSMFALGDIMAQQLVETKGLQHDLVRTGRGALYGATIFGPTYTTWLKWLNSLKFSSRFREIICKVFLDQFVYAPTIIATYFTTMTFMEGKTAADAKERLRTAYPPAVVRSCSIFVPAQALSFSLVPVQYRFFVVTTISPFWNTYLSAVNARNSRLQEAQRIAHGDDVGQRHGSDSRSA
ncbi:uncharacterized protein C8Q71DRAFT_792178 [Rhodofomes roseus]|uniref:Mpv17/PMP22 family protein n=1 Tax=Rhodofomes roseus TaxID=34475 RepID=A0ABQ8JXN6_9APHY|nr:uncharacterized protein C8Q71DRAFT_792178 [Rhodofomes roseus]KAH9828964.1 hypothetical protein C8Q71DRAFT_792178 [Rhodofomes roseus]